MLRKTLLVLSLLSAFTFGLSAQSIKGSDAVSYFQTPAQGVKFAKGYVFVSYDNQLANTKKEEQQAKNSAMGGKFGAVGGMVADVANDGLDMMQNFNTALDAFKDEDGRFATWDFVPAYIIAPTETDKNVNVEIFLMNEANPSPSARMPTTADKNGYYDIPYYVNCRYKITSFDGTVLHEENLGILEGTQKTKNYKPAPAASMGSLSSMATVEEEGIPIQDEIGTNKAYNAVRTAVFARFGFGQFYAPIKLGVVKESKASKKMIGPALDIFSNKAGLILNKEEKATIQALANEMESVLGATTEKTKWVALHNLSVCYAWLEDAEKASQYYKEYAAEIKTTLDKMECWNLCLAGKMTGKEMKAKCGSSMIGMKDQKKFAQYNNISSFVNFYPAGAVKHEQLLKTINRDLARFVDFYGINDLLCQLYEIDFPYQFLPLQDMNGAPKDLKGVITKEGMEPIEYRVKYNNKRKIKELEADQSTVLEDGSKEKLFTREIKPTYNDETGRYSHIETDAGSWARDMATGGYYSKMNTVYDPLIGATAADINNITKKAGFLGERTSNESVQLKVDLDGNIFFNGQSNYFKANAFFKGIMSANGIIPKRVDTKSTFSTKTVINEQGAMTDWTWTGDVHTTIGAMMSMRAQSLTADEMVRGLKFTEVDENGNPIKAEFIFKLKGSMDIEAKMSMKEYFAKAQTSFAPQGEMSNEAIDITQTGVWDCAFEYDANNNWTSMKIGPYTATREIKY